MKSEDFLNTSVLSLEKSLGFPYKIPVNMGGVKLGEVTIDYSINKEIIPLGKNLKEFMLTLEAITELYLLKLNFNKEINITYKIIETAIRGKFLLFLYLFYSPLSDKPLDIIDDEKIFDLIKSEGPISLKNSHIQSKLSSWLSDDNIANVRISKLGNSLLEYASVLPKKGRSQDRVLRMIDKKLIKEVYKDFTSILKIAKKKRKDYRSDEIRKFIMDISKIHLYSEDANYRKTNTRIFELMEGAMMTKAYMSKEKLKDEESRKVAVLDIYENIFVRCYEKIGPPQIISLYIEKDRDFKKWFDTFRWDPHEMAREIIAKQFGVSEDTIINILYRKR